MDFQKAIREALGKVNSGPKQPELAIVDISYRLKAILPDSNDRLVLHTVGAGGSTIQLYADELLALAKLIDSLRPWLESPIPGLLMPEFKKGE